MVSRWWLAEPSRVWLPLLLIAAALLLYVAVLPGLLERLVGLPFMVKLLVSGGTAGPVGLRHGHAISYRSAGAGGRWRVNCRLPSDHTSGNLVEWAWAMNAASSVWVGSGHHHRHPVWIECHIGAPEPAAYLARHSLLATTLRPSPADGVNPAVLVCYDSGLSRTAVTENNLCSGECVPSQKQLKWSQLKVGLTVLAASVTLGLLIFLMSGTGGLFTSKIQLKSYFDNANGLREGAPVRLAGVDIGNVTKILVVRDRTKQLTPVEVTMKVSTRYLFNLRKDSLTLLSTAGVLGETYIDIDSSQAKGPAGRRMEMCCPAAKCPTSATWCAPARARCRTWTRC